MFPIKPKDKSFVDPVIITVGLGGSDFSNKQNKNVPIKDLDIASDVEACLNNGASVFHIHARDEKGELTFQNKIVKKLCTTVRAKNPDAVLQLVTYPEFENANEDSIIRLLPEMASFYCSNEEGEMFEEKEILKLAKIFFDTHVVPCVEVYTPEQLKKFIELMKFKQGRSCVLKFPFNFNLNLRRKSMMKNFEYLHKMVKIINQFEGCTFSVTGTGRNLLKIASTAIALGGHIRVGLEHTSVMPDGTPASNVELVKSVVQIAKQMGRKIAGPYEARNIFQLKKENINRIFDHLKDGTLAPVDLSRFNELNYKELENEVNFEKDIDLPKHQLTRQNTFQDFAPEWNTLDIMKFLDTSGLASHTLKINEMCAKLKAENKEVYRVGFGQSPFPIPEFLVKKLEEYAHKNNYVPVQGLPQLRKAAAEYFKRIHGIKESTSDNIFVTPGSKNLIFLIIYILHADIILPTPSWVTYYPQSVIAKKRVEIVHTTPESNYTVTPEQIENICKKDPKRRRVIILTSPNNPTGTTISKKDAIKLSAVFRKYKVIVISDEIYSVFSRKDAHVSFAHPDVYPERTIVCSGLSKIVGAGGWRLGFGYIPKQLLFMLPSMKIVASNTFSCVHEPTQFATISCLEPNKDMDKYFDACKKILFKLGDYCHENLLKAGIDNNPLQGGFYLFLNFEKFRPLLKKKGINSAKKLMSDLLLNTGVAMIYGHAFNRKQSELSSRYCLVDFDGEKALKAVYEGKTVDEEFLKTYCTNTYKSVEKIVNYVKSL